MLVLGSLQYLGRGWTFDDVEENTAISKEVHRTFFHRFVEFGSTVLYDKYVLTPNNVNEAKTHMREFEEAGFLGCVGSLDETHITTDRCEYNLKNNHLGPKSSLTARSYNLCVNHRRRILHSTPGGPARWNDQTMVRFDRFITQIRSDGLNLQENTFELLARGKGGEVIAVKYKGVYVIVDNGYLNWSCTVPPFTVTSNIVPIKELMDSSLDFLPWIPIKRLLHNLPFVCHLLLLISLEHEDITVKGSQLAEIAEDSTGRTIILCLFLWSFSSPIIARG